MGHAENRQADAHRLGQKVGSVNSETQRRELCAKIDVARDLLDRAEIVLQVEWKEVSAEMFLHYVERAVLVAARECHAFCDGAMFLRGEYDKEKERA